MGRFSATEKDLQPKPFIINSEIIGMSIQKSRIYFNESVQEKIFESLNDWTEEGGMIGKQFVICVNGKIISNGYFDSMWNRFECKTNRILFFQDKIGANNEIGFLIDSAKIPINDMKNNSTLKTIFKDRLRD